jgi:hypothetical protein
MLGSSDEDFALSQMCMAEGEDIYSLMGDADLASWKPADVRAAKAVRVRTRHAPPFSSLFFDRSP